MLTKWAFVISKRTQ